MKAQVINDAQQLTHNREQFRIALIIGGIMIAIIVSLFVMHDAGIQPSFTSALPEFPALPDVSFPSSSAAAEAVTHAAAAILK